MEETDALPEWLTVGSKVAVFYDHQYGNSFGGFAEVVRTTKSQVIVLDRGSEVRYRRSDLHRVGVDYYQSPQLMPPTDKMVRASLREHAVSRAMSELTRVIEANRRHGSDLDRAVSEVSAIKVAADKALAELGRIHEEFSE